VRTKWGQCAVAFTVALAEAILRLNRVVHAPYYALFLVGPAANALEIWWDSRRKPAAAPAVPSAVRVSPSEVAAVLQAPAWIPSEQPVSPL
jgi:hypothetical protein